MAFMNKERKAERAPVIKAILKKYHDAEKAERMGEEKIANFISEVVDAMFGKDYFNESDAMTDYFHCSHYIDIKVGKWDKEYEYTGA